MSVRNVFVDFRLLIGSGLVVGMMTAGCGASFTTDHRPPVVDLDGNQRITADELRVAVAERTGRELSPAAAAAMIAGCDVDRRDNAIEGEEELRCLDRQPLAPASSLALGDALPIPLLAPLPGWLMVLTIIVAIVLVAPFLAARVIRTAGWLFKARTRGAWFRVAPPIQFLLAVLAGLVTAGLAVLLLLLIDVGVPFTIEEWWPFTFLWQASAWRAFLVAGSVMVWALTVLAALLAVAKWSSIAGASRRLLALEHNVGQPSRPNLPRPLPKNIVICCDGTGNTGKAVEDGRPAVSNVWKLFDLVVSAPDSGWHQVKWYDDGVGTETSGSSKRLGLIQRTASWVGANTPARVVGVFEKLRMIYELGFGIGITENVSQGYREIVRQYEPGDRIFLVGFSRGAYTARCIADVIDDIGLLRSEHVRYAFDVVQFYRYRNSTQAAVHLDRRLMHDDAPIEFLGLWDTVASLGVPLWGWSYSIGGLWSNQGMGVTDIRNCRVVRHALSMDEERSQFFPTLFDESPDETGARRDIQQRWFRGSHAGVGGGYSDCSLSDVALTWMIEEARNRGLAFVDNWKATLSPNPLGIVITQLEKQRAWRLSGTWPRWHPCVATGSPGAGSTGFGVLDRSVMDRATHARSLRVGEAAVSSDELLRLGAGESAVVRIRGDYTWHRTGVVLEPGARYRITYTGGLWQDKEASPCGPDGQDATGMDLRRVLGRGKRFRAAKWMELIGHVAHPRVWPQLELPAKRLLKDLLVKDPEALTDTLIRLGQHLTAPGASVDLEVASQAGVFYGFANDWALFYDNNSGVITLQIQRLSGEPPRVDGASYVVATDGTISQGVMH